MENIRKYRKMMRMSQEQLAKLIGVTQGAVVQWERGNTRPALDKLIKLSDIFGVTVDELIRKAG